MRILEAVIWALLPLALIAIAFSAAYVSLPPIYHLH